MKKLIVLFMVIMLTLQTGAQQIGDGWSTGIPDFAGLLKTGAYQSEYPYNGVPDSTHTWQHLFVMRHSNQGNNHQFQLGSTYAENDRLFFRKIASVDTIAKSTLWNEIATRGANKFTGSQIFENGDIGIGTSTPQAKLDIRGNVYINTGTDYNRITWGGHYMTMGTAEGDYAHNVFALKPGGANQGQLNSVLEMYTAHSPSNHERKVLIQSEGDSYFNGNKMGVGTISPSTRLDIFNTAQSGHLTLSANDNADADMTRIDLDYKIADHEQVIGRISSAYLTSADGGSGALRFFTRNNGDLGERMRIDSEGRVGIGTTSPVAKFQIGDSSSDKGAPIMRVLAPPSGTAGTVVDALHIDTYNGGNFDQGVAISLGHASNQYGEYTSRIVHYGNTGETRASKLHLQTHSSTHGIWNTGILIDQEGKVGIGTMNPATMLQVSKSDSSRNLALLNTAAIDIWNKGDQTNSGGQINFRSGTSEGATGIGAIIGYLNKNSNTSGSVGDLVLGVKSALSDTAMVQALTIQSGGNVGIGIDTPQVKLHLDNDGAFLAQGTYDNGWTESNLGAGTRMLWYPRKAAFRAGHVNSTQWDNNNIGNYSFANGFNTISSGTSSIAMGHDSRATNSYAVAMGMQATASNMSAMALGYQVTASGKYATSLGYVSRAEGEHSIALGKWVNATGTNSIVIGLGASSSSRLVNNTPNSLMVGFNTATPALFVGSKVGIGTKNPDEMLTVKGKIHAEEVIIDLSVPAADYVFNSDYSLMPLHKVEAFVKTNKHLPEIPSATEVKEKGLSIGEMQNKLLQKIEELTLYVIELQKTNEKQSAEIEELKRK